jgi:hypothetical protein
MLLPAQPACSNATVGGAKSPFFAVASKTLTSGFPHSTPTAFCSPTFSSLITYHAPHFLPRIRKNAHFDPFYSPEYRTKYRNVSNLWLPLLIEDAAAGPRHIGLTHTLPTRTSRSHLGREQIPVTTRRAFFGICLTSLHLRFQRRNGLTNDLGQFPIFLKKAQKSR